MSGNNNNKNTISKGDNTKNEKNNKGKKRFNNKTKPYFNQNQPSGNLKKKSKTLFIGKIYNEDIEESDVSSQLASHRINYLKSVLENYGEVEHFSNNIENNNFVLVTYRTHEMAERALKKLKNKSENENIMGQIKDQLRKNKLPDTVCPLLFRYKYDWSDKPSRAPKNAYSSVKKSSPKTEGSSTATTQGGAQKKKNTNEAKVNGSKAVNNNNAENSSEEKKKKKKKAKKKYQKKTEEEKVEEVEKVFVKEEPVKEPVKKEKIVKEKRVVDADGLRREADKAKLEDELEYLAAQLENVQSEINAENKRCKDRDVRINKLTEELTRVDLAKERLERQLNNERRWKKLNQDTVNQLNQELTHIREEQQSATLRLNQSDSADQSPFSFAS